MRYLSKRWLTFTLRWGIAVVGVFIVLKNITFHDRVMVLDPATGRPVHVRVLGDASDDDALFRLAEPVNTGKGPVREVTRDQLWTQPSALSEKISTQSGAIETVKVLAVRPNLNDARHRSIELAVEDPKSHQTQRMSASRVVGGIQEHTPYPLVEVGLVRMVRQANPRYLLLSLLVIPLSYLLTSYRWHLLLEALDIRIGLGRTFVINMVGAFYNSFMPGSTGGDLVKAYYASKHTTHRTRAVISVLTDRAIGLLALIIVGGVMAAAQYQIPACRKVAMVSAALLAAAVLGLVVFYTPALRRITGLDYILRRLPLQKQVNNAVVAMEMYGRRPLTSLAAMAVCFPIHFTTIISATLAGLALGLKMPISYYWVVVPVIALVGAIPISPQGAGVMEGFAVLLTRSQGVSVSQAVALTMSIRLVQIFWNLVAGIFVLRGGYHAPTAVEQHELEDDGQDTDNQSMQAQLGTAAVQV